MASVKSLIDLVVGPTYNQADLVAALRGLSRAPIGCGQLSKSGSNLILLPHNGNDRLIAGELEEIPSAGVTLAPTGATPDTTCFIYSYMNAGVMTLEFSTTGYVVDSTHGHAVKSGDSSRSLEGMARAITGPAWADTETQRFVRSWYNDPLIHTRDAFSANRTTTSTTNVEIHSEIRSEFLVWAGELVLARLHILMSNSGAGGVTAASVAFDGGTGDELLTQIQKATAGHFAICSYVYLKTGLAEGYHFISLIGRVGSGTGTYNATGSDLGVILVGAGR
jgi:hypothetical protein